MSSIQACIQAHLPRRRKKTPSGWESFNSVCCHHRGERTDTRMRGGAIFTGEGFTYSCFNCGFKTGWTPGNSLNQNCRLLLAWMGVSPEEISQLALDAFKQKDQLPVMKEVSQVFEERDLPPNTKSFSSWADENCQDPNFLSAVMYVIDRGMQLDWYNWSWSSELGYSDRIIIPFYYQEKIVGWTARKISDGRPKYLSSQQPGFVFNLDNQTDRRQFVVVTEGQFDAIGIDGVAVMHNTVSSQQAAKINSLQREVIVVPDRDPAGCKLIDTAVEHNWSASLPDWGSEVKDVADAVKKYGRIYALYTILKYRQHGSIKLTMLKKRIENESR